MVKAICRSCALLAMLTLALSAHAGPFKRIQSQPISEVWLNPGMYSWHFNRHKGLNGSNFGFGAEYRYSTVSSVTAGVFDNSDRRTSHYLGWYWQPVAMGPLRIGAVAGAIDGYPKMRNGGWFPAVIPTVSMEYGRIGMNLMIIPGYKDRLYGALSLQIKVRVF